MVMQLGMKTLAAIVVVAGSAAPTFGSNNLGCQVLLCMANPKGPTALVECVPPMRELAKRLATGRSFPGCSMGGGAKIEHKGDLVIFRQQGEPARYYNLKTGQNYEEQPVVPGGGSAPKPPSNGGNTQQQLR